MPKPYGVELRERTVAALAAQLQADPDGRLLDHCRWWQESTGQRVSLTALHRARRASGCPWVDDHCSHRKKKGEEKRFVGNEVRKSLKKADPAVHFQIGRIRPISDRSPQAPTNRGPNTTVISATAQAGLLVSMTVEGGLTPRPS